MPGKQKLKVYRPPIGFHDAYVAAPSQKGALKVWGSDANLFASGAAEMVTDDDLTKEALAKPGAIVRRLRGTKDEHIATLPADAPAPKRRTSPPEDDGLRPRRDKPRKADRSTPTRTATRADRPDQAPAEEKPLAKPKPEPRRAPRPSRAMLDAAEHAIEEARAEHDAAVADIRRREGELRQERRDLEQQYENKAAKLDASLAKVRERYQAALVRWRD